jgi:hypothetical protein
LLLLEGPYCTDPYNSEEGVYFEVLLLHKNRGIFLVFLGSFLLLSVQLLFGTDFEVMKEGRVVKQCGFSGHFFQGKKLGLLGAVSYFSWL